MRECKHEKSEHHQSLKTLGIKHIKTMLNNFRYFQRLQATYVASHKAQRTWYAITKLNIVYPMYHYQTRNCINKASCCCNFNPVEYNRDFRGIWMEQAVRVRHWNCNAWLQGFWLLKYNERSKQYGRQHVNCIIFKQRRCLQAYNFLIHIWEWKQSLNHPFSLAHNSDLLYCHIDCKSSTVVTNRNMQKAHVFLCIWRLQ